MSIIAIRAPMFHRSLICPSYPIIPSVEKAVTKYLKAPINIDQIS